MQEGSRRGPARSEASRLAILHATANQLARHGYEHLTMEGIAAEAQVGKQTIYRWWPSKGALIAECLEEGLLIPGWFLPPDSGDLRADLTTWLDAIVAFIALPGNGDLVRSLVVAGAENEDVALRFNERLGIFALVTDRFGPGGAPAEFGEALLGALVVRILRRGPLDAEFVRRLVATVL